MLKTMSFDVLTYQEMDKVVDSIILQFSEIFYGLDKIIY